MSQGSQRILRLLSSGLLISLLAICVGCRSTDAGEQLRNNLEQSRGFYVRRNDAGRVIVFVHGIFGSSHDTWKCSEQVSWPDLLQDDVAFRDSDIYVAGYETPYLGNRMTIDEIVSNLKSRFDNDEVFSKHREVIFVAHSMGGLVAQRLLLTYRGLAKQVQFVYFYSTPETGAQIAKLGKMFSSDPLLKEMFPGDSNDYLMNLESEWQNADFTIHRYCAYERKPLGGVLVVDRLSGTRACERAIAINENHATIVKPCDRNADSYIALRNAIIANPIAALRRAAAEKPGPAASPQTQIIGSWSGTQDYTNLPIVLHISGPESDMTATIESPCQPGFGSIPVDYIQRSGTSLAFKVSGTGTNAPFEFNGQIAPSSITGVSHQGPWNLSLTMKPGVSTTPCPGQ